VRVYVHIERCPVYGLVGWKVVLEKIDFFLEFLLAESHQIFKGNRMHDRYINLRW
jgi:hypothetical protein